MSDNDTNLSVQLIKAVLSPLIRGLQVIFPTPPVDDDEADGEDEESVDKEADDDNEEERDSSDNEPDDEGYEVVGEDDFPYTFSIAIVDDEASEVFGKLCMEHGLDGSVIESLLNEVDGLLDPENPELCPKNLFEAAQQFVLYDLEEVFDHGYVDMLSAYLQFADPDDAEQHIEQAVQLSRELMEQELARQDDGDKEPDESEQPTLENLPEEPAAPVDLPPPPPEPEPEPAPEPPPAATAAAPTRPRRTAAAAPPEPPPATEPVAPPAEPVADPTAQAPGRPRRTTAPPPPEPEPEPEPTRSRPVRKGRPGSSDLPLADKAVTSLTRARLSALPMYREYIEVVLRAIETGGKPLLRQIFNLTLPGLDKVASGSDDSLELMPREDADGVWYDDDWWQDQNKTAAERLANEMRQRLKRAGHTQAPQGW